MGAKNKILVSVSTFGTLASLVFLAVLKPPLPLHSAMIIVVTTIGVYSSSSAERLSGIKDPGHIVIDEFAGYMVSMLFLPFNYGYITASFILFRIFDIIKPPPIKGVEHALKGGLGIMADDIVAGIYANIAIQAWRYLILS